MSKSNPDSEFLMEVLQACEDAQFRQAQLDRMLQVVRRQHQTRRWRRRLVICLAITIPCGWIYWRWSNQLSALPDTGIDSSVRVVATSKAYAPAYVSSDAGSIRVINTDQARVEDGIRSLATSPERPCHRLIGDDELVTLLAGYSGALIRRSPTEAQVVMADLRQEADVAHPQ